ncbi:MAG: thiamine-phosphate kinase [Chitinispirillaceae bacterium]|nr:thiamine-phosphate kinase [Chitinispirillaceae bacterium]
MITSTPRKRIFIPSMNRRYPSNEYKLCTALEKALGRAARRGVPYELVMGDDAAVRRCRQGERIVLTADSAVENVHFTRTHLSMRQVGFRAAAANVSDCAAMGALPEAALVQLVLPHHAPRRAREAVALYKGIAEACRYWNVRIVGGDCVSGPAWAIGITMIGTVPRSGRVCTRKGIRAGDALWLSGFPGLSAAGLAALSVWGKGAVPRRYRTLVNCHVRPLPSPDLGRMLGAHRQVHAMMDLSDGLSKDARTLCYENRLGLDISLDTGMVPHAMLSLSREIDIPWQEWALHGGEDYTLLYAAAPALDPGRLHARHRTAMVRIGTFTARHHSIVLHNGGRRMTLRNKSWDHLT